MSCGHRRVARGCRRRRAEDRLHPGLDANIDKISPKPDHKRDRRRVILKSFDGFARICVKRAAER
jgi:hypothetical protein